MGDASLIPTVVALSNFFVQNFPDISWYPYWYLGNPFNYLIGPVAPFSLLILNKAFFLPVSFAYFFLISLSFLIGASGLYVLLRSLDGEKRVCLISSILFLILPFSPYLLFYQNGLHHVTFGFLPWILLLFLKLIKNSGPKNAIFLSIAIAFVLLIDVSILLPLIVGFVALYVSLGLKRDTEDKAVKTVLITLLGVSLATVWYTPRFWWVLLANPSFGGVPLFNLIVSLFKFLLKSRPNRKRIHFYRNPIIVRRFWGAPTRIGFCFWIRIAFFTYSGRSLGSRISSSYFSAIISIACDLSLRPYCALMMLIILFACSEMLMNALTIGM